MSRSLFQLFSLNPGVEFCLEKKYEPEENQVHRNNWVSGVDGKFTFPKVDTGFSSARRARRTRHGVLSLLVLSPKHRNNLVHTTSVPQKRTVGSGVP